MFSLANLKDWEIWEKECLTLSTVCNCTDLNFLIINILPLQNLSAFNVSAVSPDCEMKMHTSSLKTGVSQSKNSEAISSITGNWVSSCIKALVATAE